MSTAVTNSLRPARRGDIWLSWTLLTAMTCAIWLSLSGLLISSVSASALLPVSVAVPLFALALVAFSQWLVLRRYGFHLNGFEWVIASMGGFLGATVLAVLSGGLCVVLWFMVGRSSGDYTPYSTTMIQIYLVYILLVLTWLGAWGVMAHWQWRVLTWHRLVTATWRRRWIAANLLVALVVASISYAVAASRLRNLSGTSGPQYFEGVAPSFLAVFGFGQGIVIGFVTGYVMATAILEKKTLASEPSEGKSISSTPE
jgi:hypothetical protein